MTAILSTKGASKFFGGVKAVSDVSIDVNRGEIVSLIGPNGAGKTTLFNLITGMYEPTSGKILFSGRGSEIELSGRKPHEIAEHGIARTFQNIRLFNRISALENIRVGMHTRAVRPFARSLGVFICFWLAAYAMWLAGGIAGYLLYFASLALAGFIEYAAWRRELGNPVSETARTAVAVAIVALLAALVLDIVAFFISGAAPERGSWQFALPLVYCGYISWRTWSVNSRDEEERALAQRYMRFVGLSGHEYEQADALPYGLKRRLEIARALASKPGLLLLDEPAAGMNPAESEDLMKLIKNIRDSGLTVFLIEHDMKVVMGISDRIYVLDHGELIAEGAPAEIRANPKVVEAYLGKEAV